MDGVVIQFGVQSCRSRAGTAEHSRPAIIPPAPTMAKMGVEARLCDLMADATSDQRIATDDADAAIEAKRKAKALERLQMDINWRLTVEAIDADNLIYAKNDVVHASATITVAKHK